ncbi:MAG: glutaredoxin family protein [Thermoleophilia bacterium]|nr:glutaredoxin family protein [Gaiellaceae bacterium]MDW8339118.1 glutaredoxin family protein [Thermoleophilia bacterium]
MLYTAAGCGLCDDALAVLQAARSELGFSLEVVAIDGDDALERRYRALVPVVEVDGEEAFVHEVDPDELAALLAR